MGSSSPGRRASSAATYPGCSSGRQPYTPHWSTRLQQTFFTATLDNQPTRDQNTCGHPAGTVVHWSVLQIPDVSLRKYFPQTLEAGLRRYGSPHQDVHLRSFLHLRP